MNMKFRMRVESQKDNWFLSLALLSTNGKHYRYLQSMLNGKNLLVEPIFDGNHKSRLYCSNPEKIASSPGFIQRSLLTRRSTLKAKFTFSILFA